jgi:uncharacterized cupredoxin-like copper-binding protein
VIPALVAAFAAATTTVGVGEREWSLSAYVPRVPRGTVVFNVHNFGEDAHDLKVRGPHGYRSATSNRIEPGANATLRVRLLRVGAYRLVCTLPGHAARGMRATIHVRA